VAVSSSAGGRDGAEVVLVVVEGGGNTWLGRQPPVRFLGQATRNVSANDLLWEFFQKHPMKRLPLFGRYFQDVVTA
jgi:polyhydroxybutyrate depolymerase